MEDCARAQQSTLSYTVEEGFIELCYAGQNVVRYQDMYHTTVLPALEGAERP